MCCSQRRFGLVCLMLNVSVNNFSVMLGQSHRFLDITSIFGRGCKHGLLKDTTRRKEDMLKVLPYNAVNNNDDDDDDDNNNNNNNNNSNNNVFIFRG